MSNKVSAFLKPPPKHKAINPAGLLMSTRWQSPDSGTTPSGARSRAEMAQQGLVALGQVQPSQREVVVLAIFDELPVSEIAKIYDVTADAASMRLKRALDAWRRSMSTCELSG